MFLVLFDQNDELKTNMKICNGFVGLAEYSAISMEGVNKKNCLYFVEFVILNKKYEI
jgi:hypothetical protein